MMNFLFLLTLLISPMVSVQAEDQIAEQTAPQATVSLTLEDALKIALSENVSVKVADQEIQRATYAKRGTYAALFPQIDGSMSYQRTIKKQVMYMDFDLSSMGGGLGGGAGTGAGSDEDQGVAPAAESSNKGGIEVGRWNTWNGGISASMPLVNAQLWKSLSISADEVELAIEKARGSRLSMVTSVKEAFYGVLLAKAACGVYEQSLKNAEANLEVTQVRFASQKASEMDLQRAKTTVASVIPDLYNAKNNVTLSLWRLKAVMGIDLDMDIDVVGSLEDYSSTLFYQPVDSEDPDLSGNSSLRQLEMQIGELAKTVQLNQLAYVPSLAVAFNYSYNAMTNDFNFKEYRWTPYSYVGLSLQIPIFSGGKRYHAVKQSQVQLAQAKLRQEQTERELKIAVRSYLATMETNVNSYYAALSAYESAQKGYDITASSYEVGRSTLIEVNDALLSRAQTQLMQLQSIYSYLVAKAGLEEQLGKNFEQE